LLWIQATLYRLVTLAYHCLTCTCVVQALPGYTLDTRVLKKWLKQHLAFFHSYQSCVSVKEIASRQKHHAAAAAAAAVTAAKLRAEMSKLQQKLGCAMTRLHQFIMTNPLWLRSFCIMSALLPPCGRQQVEAACPQTAAAGQSQLYVLYMLHGHVALSCCTGFAYDCGFDCDRCKALRVHWHSLGMNVDQLPAAADLAYSL